MRFDSPSRPASHDALKKKLADDRQAANQQGREGTRYVEERSVAEKRAEKPTRSLQEEAQQLSRAQEQQQELQRLLGQDGERQKNLTSEYQRLATYAKQEESILSSLGQELMALQERRARMHGSFVKGFFGRLSGDEQATAAEIVRLQQVVDQKRKLVEGTNGQLAHLAEERSALMALQKSRTEESGRLQRARVAFEARYAEAPVRQVEVSDEQKWREGLFAGMEEAELNVAREEYARERTLLSRKMKASEQKKSELEHTLQQIEAQSVPTAEMHQIAEFLSETVRINGVAAARCEEAKQKREALRAGSFLSRVFNQAEMKALDQEVWGQQKTMQEMDQRMQAGQKRLLEIQKDPARLTADLQGKELLLQLSQVKKQAELTRQLLTENELRTTEIDLRLLRATLERPEPVPAPAPVSATALRDRLRVPQERPRVDEERAAA